MTNALRRRGGQRAIRKFETQERILKDSARWYRDTIAANAVARLPES